MIKINTFALKTKKIIKEILKKDLRYRIQHKCPKQLFGSEYGGYFLCPDLVSKDSIIYSFGIGEDISFDLALIENFDVDIYAFDFTPKSNEWVKKQNLPSKFHLYKYGLMNYDGKIKIFPPNNPEHISHTILVNEFNTEPIEVEVYRLQTILKMLGHSKIDLLKMDIEGAEFEVIDDLVSSNIEINQLLVEFHHTIFSSIHISKLKAAIENLNRIGYKIFHISPNGIVYSFIRY